MRITNLPRIREAVASSVWLIEETKLHAIYDVLRLRTSETPLTAEEIQARIGDRNVAARATTMTGAIAVIPLQGTLYPKANMVTESSGGQSVSQFVAQMEAAAADPNVSAIVIDVDSPGGNAQGIPEAAARIRALRGTKPIVAVATGMMASGAYWLGAQADSVVGSMSSEIGSVGAFMVHQDVSEALAKEGVKMTLIRAGEFKAETNPFEPLSKEAFDALQSRVEDAHTMFVNDLAKARGITAAKVRSDYGKGRVLSPKNALEAGMIDRLGTLQSVVRDLAGPNAKKYLRGASADIGAIEAHDEFDALSAALQTLQGDGASFEIVAVHREAEQALAALHELATSSAGSMAVHASTSTNPTPPLAEEHPVPPVSDTPTNAATSAATAEPSREAQLHELAKLTKNEDKYFEWVGSGKSVAEIRTGLLNAQPAPAPANSTNIRVGVQRETQKDWESYGHFALAVYNAGQSGVREIDPRLYAAATGINQASPSEGGFAVPGTYAKDLWEGLFGDPSSLLSMTDNYNVEGAFIEFPRIEETTRATDTVAGGVTAYWRNEADQIGNTKPKFGTMRLEPQELNALIYITEKHLANSPFAMGQYLDRMGKRAIMLKVNKALVGGTGSGQPKGLTTSGCKITVSKETSQAADTIIAKNIGKMKSRRVGSVASEYVWLANTDIQPELDNLSTIVQNIAGTENVGGYASPLYNPDSNKLGGLQVHWNDHCEAIGDEGDLILVHLKSYAVGLRAMGVQTAQSFHLRFDYKEAAFRYDFEIDGQCWLHTALTPAKGTTKSPVITLQAR